MSGVFRHSQSHYVSVDLKYFKGRKSCSWATELQALWWDRSGIYCLEQYIVELVI